MMARTPLRGRQDRRVQAEDAGRGAAGPGEIGFITRRSSRWPTPGSATPSPTKRNPAPRRCPAISRRNQWCSAGCFRSTPRFEDLRAAIGKLRLNDASFSFEMESSAALVLAFAADFWACCTSRSYRSACARVQPGPHRDGALGRLQDQAHQWRRNRAAQSRRHAGCGQDRRDSGTLDPRDDHDARRLLGAVLKLCQDRRGIQADLNYVGKRAMAIYDLPLNEVVFDFYDA